MSARDIYAKLIAAGLTHEGTCGLMGNMQAESTLKANIAQRGMTALSDEEYTSAATEWPVKFIHDGVGYGLCQWTYWSRKQALFNFAQARGGDVVITGGFDRRFKNRVMEWQSFNGLAADGIIGAATWAALLRR